MQINDKDAGAYMKVVSGGGARGVAAGTGDNTEAVGAIVDQLAHEGLRSGALVIAGSAVLAEDKTIALNAVGIEHGDESDLSDKADFNTEVDFAAVATGGTGGSTELFAQKLKLDLWGVKRYWRVKVTPDLDATGTDTFQLGFAFVAIGESAPLS
jgi:hypothetical protein